MTPADLEILIQQGEGTTLEFKESLSSSFAREVVALANTIGGKILLGVRDDGSVIGVEDTNTLRARVQDVARNCDPPGEGAGGAGGRGARGPRPGERRQAGAVPRRLLLASGRGDPEDEP